MLMTAIAKKMMATKDGTNKNKIPKLIEIMVDRIAIKESVGIPVKYIGLGEQKEDLRTFDIEKYIYGLFKTMIGGEDDGK